MKQDTRFICSLFIEKYTIVVYGDFKAPAKIKRKSGYA